MGSVVQLNRRRAVARVWQKTPQKAPVDVEARESAMSMAVLVGVFSLTAIAMGVAVVVEASNTWRDVAVMSAFVIVFGLTKVALANALFYVMVSSDAKMEAVSANTKAAAGMVFRRPHARPPKRTLKPPILLHQAGTKRSAKPNPQNPPRPPGGR
jgi:hypothetical protein